LSNEKSSEKNSIGMEIDLDSTLHVADKVTDFLDKSMKKPFERYIVARLISILYEETWNFSLDPEFEAEVRKLAKKKPEKLDTD
jgi:hypothetical protein